MGCIFKYSDGSTRYLTADIIMRKLTGINTEVSESSMENRPIMVRKIKTPIKTYSFSDLKEILLKKVGYGVNMNKLLAFNRDYIDAILFIAVNGYLDSAILNKILAADTQEQRKSYIIDCLYKVSYGNLFNPFITNLIASKNDNTGKYKFGDITATPNVSLNGGLMNTLLTERNLCVRTLYSNPTKNVSFILTRSETMQNQSQTALYNAYAKIYSNVDFSKPGMNTYASVMKELKALESKASSIAYIGLHFDLLQACEEFDLVMKTKDNVTFYKMESNAYYYTKVSENDEFDSSITYYEYSNDDYALYYCSTKQQFEANRSGLYIRKTNYDADKTYYTKTPGGEYVEQNVPLGETEYSNKNAVFYSKVSSVINYIYNFGTGFSSKYAAILRNIISNYLNLEISESRIATESSRLEYKDELMTKLYNLDKKKNSLGLYGPVIMDCLKNYIDWLFDDGYKVADELVMTFDYTISNDIKLYLEYLDLLQKLFAIDDSMIEKNNKITMVQSSSVLKTSSDENLIGGGLNGRLTK